MDDMTQSFAFFNSYFYWYRTPAAPRDGCELKD
jgi:hypothetical protein